jgi:UPF0755 protein
MSKFHPRRLTLPLIILILTLFLPSLSLFLPTNNQNLEKIEFEVLPGQKIPEIAKNLKEKKLIRSELALQAYLYLNGLNKKVQAGYFYLSPSQSTGEIAESLTKAVAKRIRVTLPEGLRRQEIANLILDTLEETNTPHKFDPDIFINKTTDLEGQLFPDTYDLSPNITTDDLIKKLNDRYLEITNTLNLKPEELKQVTILASLIEREAGADSEKAEIAGILTNRLNNQWPLQVDATIQFARSNSRCYLRLCDWWPSPLTKTDLQINSPFNTYLHSGLPPSPIGNPGKASLEAAANPNKTKNWFYLHDLSGKIHYASTVEEHNQNICRYLKKDC